jgi:hypothetical protein
MRKSIEQHLDYVKNETLTVELEFSTFDGDAVILNGHATKIKISKV